jgi:Mg-chelatase subunit ChlD
MEVIPNDIPPVPLPPNDASTQSSLLDAPQASNPYNTTPASPVSPPTKNTNKTIFLIIITIIILVVLGFAALLWFIVANRRVAVPVDGPFGGGQNEIMTNDSGNNDNENKASRTQNNSNELQVQTTQDNTKCDNEYDALITKYGRTYEDCQATIRQADCDQSGRSGNKKRNVVLIFDSSGSMAANMGGKTKLDVAKEATENFTKDLSEDVNLSVVAYGHTGSNSTSSKGMSCVGIEEIYWLGAVNQNIINGKISALKATGWTPIAGALQKAKDILANYSAEQYNNSVLLISDGEETCDGDPAAKAKELNGSSINVVVNVIGFDVGGKAEAQLKNTAENGKGMYYSARNASELNAAFGKIGMGCVLQMNSVRNQNEASVNTRGNDCSARLNQEDSDMTWAINVRNEASDECRDYIWNKYSERTDSVKAQLEEIDAENRNDLYKSSGYVK